MSRIQLALAMPKALRRPGGNATGFVSFEYNLSGKWVELLKQDRTGRDTGRSLGDAAISSGIGQFAVIQSVALIYRGAT